MATTIGNTTFKGVTKRGNSFKISIYYYDENGVNQRVYFNYKIPPNITEKELEKALRAEIEAHERALQAGATKKAPKFKVLCQEWLDNVSANNHAIATYETEKCNAKRVCEAIGDIAVDKLTARAVQSFLQDCTKDGKNKARSGGLSSGYIRKYRTLIVNVMDYARRQGYITTNSVKYDTEIPKQKHKNQRNCKRDREFRMFSESETLYFKDLLSDLPLNRRVFFLILLATGCRKGEALGLEFSDIDYSTGSILFDRDLVRVAGKEAVVNYDMKTKNSHRTNYLPQSVLAEIRALEAEQREKAVQLGALWKDKRGALFTGLYGQALCLTNPNDWLNRIIEQNDDVLPHVTVHSFRHLFVSSLIDSGKYPVTQIAKMVGDTVTTITNTYAHALKKAETTPEPPANSLAVFAGKDGKRDKRRDKVFMLDFPKAKTQ